MGTAGEYLMGTGLTPDEQAGVAMHPVWCALVPVREFTESQTRFILQELPADVVWSAAGLTAANELAREFRDEIWPHRIPDRWELVLADRAGRLTETIAGLNAAYAAGQ